MNEGHRVDLEFLQSDKGDAIEIRIITVDGAKLTGQMIMDAVVDMLQFMRTGTPIDDTPSSKLLH